VAKRKGTGPKRTPKQREADLQRIVDLYVKGWTQWKIGQELGLTQQTVSNDLKEIHKQWREHTTLSLDDYKQKELKKLDRLEVEYWDAWQRSQEDAKTLKQKSGTVPTGATELREMIQQETAGDARFLDGVLKCIDRRSKLLGLDAPVKTEVEGQLSVEDLLLSIAKAPRDPEEDE